MSNLPPGVSDHDIPGNRPEDELYDRATVAITEAAEQFGCLVDGAATNEELAELDLVVSSFVSFVQRYRKEVEGPAELLYCGHCGAGPADANGELPHFRDCQDR